MTHTYPAITPSNNATLMAEGVIPNGLVTASDWTEDTGLGAPYGAMYSSLRDMTAAGRAMLNSTLLPPAMTRRWLKPGAHTDSLYGSVGKPWEIARSFVNGRVVDAYAKTGNIGDYGAVIVLVPDYGVGFNVLTAAQAGPLGGPAPEVFATLVAETLAPALEWEAKEQAVGKYVGVYNATSAAASGGGVSNSSLVLQADELPGLAITGFVSNSSDFLAVVAQDMGISRDEVSIRAYPTNLRSSVSSHIGTLNGTATRVAFNLMARAANQPATEGGWFNVDCSSWFSADLFEYGGAPLEQLVFEVDSCGKVIAVENPALRVVMAKTA